MNIVYKIFTSFPPLEYNHKNFNFMAKKERIKLVKKFFSGIAVEAAVQFFQFQSLVSKKSIDKFLF